MARSDVNLYFLQQQDLYFEMLDNLKDLKEELEKGHISPEDYSQARREVELLKSNYERLAYIIMLLNKPNRKDNKNADLNRSWYNALKGASKEAILDESKDVLVDLKALIKKGQNYNG